MKKSFKINNLDCANCASKMENAIKKIKGVNDASVSFMTHKLTLEAEDEKYNDILNQAFSICKKIEPDCTIIIK